MDQYFSASSTHGIIEEMDNHMHKRRIGLRLCQEHLLQARDVHLDARAGHMTAWKMKLSPEP